MVAQDCPEQTDQAHAPTRPVPGAFGVEPLGINNLGQIVGDYAYNNQSYGFLFDNGVYTTLSGPLGSWAQAEGINDRGQIVGNYISVGNVSATPLPSALPLFATGLGALGLLRWLRKRRSVTAIAAA
jgi:uncharacterized membrane protein